MHFLHLLAISFLIFCQIFLNHNWVFFYSTKKEKSFDKKRKKKKKRQWNASYKDTTEENQSWQHHCTYMCSVSTFHNQISWYKLWKFLEFHKISWKFTKCSNLLLVYINRISLRMLLIPKKKNYSRNVLFISWKIPKIPENSWISGEAETLYIVCNY